MPTGTIDSAIFKDIFGTEAMRQVWSDGNRIQKYLDFEAGLARAQAKLKIIPQEACDEILKHVKVEQYDIAKLKSETERIGYPVLPVVSQLVKLCKEGLGEWCHWGATTQDITDTATIMQIREALAIVGKDIDDISDALAALAKKYRDTPMAGRSNLQQAVPITFGYKCATYLAAFERHKQRLKQLRERTFVFEFGGAAGTLSSLGKDGLRTQVELAKELDLAQPEIAWHTVHDRIAEVGCFLGLVTGICNKIAYDVKLMMQTEVEEVYEPYHPGAARPRPCRRSATRSPASTSPRKRAWCGAWSGSLLNAMEQDHERATGQWEIEWIVLPEIFVLSAGCLAQTKFLVVGPAGRRKANAGEPRHHQGTDRLGGGDDGARPGSGPPVRPRPGL